MAQYRKKPVVIEAVAVPNNEYADDPMGGWQETPDWLQEAFTNGVIEPAFRGEDYWYYRITTMEGDILASPDDWIIKGVQGELYPCKPDIFAATYESA